MKIEEIDKNFKQATLGGQEVRFYDAHVAPFSVEGFPCRKDGEKTFYRLPRKFTKKDVNEGALWLSNHTSGGAIRFRTDSPFVAIRADLVCSSDMNHMPRAGSAGFDIYYGSGANCDHIGTAQPNRDQAKMEQIICWNPVRGKVGDFILNLPLYGGCKNIEIGIAPGSKLLPPKAHKVKLPILFYGSSITQGGCASRPGNAYTSRVCRTVDAEQINWGFSGSGRGEIAVAKAIAKIPLAVFVLDYDYNAPTIEHLKDTHEKFFLEVRKAQPDLPVIIMPACNIFPRFDTAAYQNLVKRAAIIKETYDRAIARGDKNVYFIEGTKLFEGSERSACTVDGCHPNDLGFDRMYHAVLPVVKKILKNEE